MDNNGEIKSLNQKSLSLETIWLVLQEKEIYNLFS
jgi:hypothetical protein